ncbi:MAG: hypothetical protein KJ667_09615 [Alphaproteobacteria bacterium]|nr:hypothetical protein [Alphaproteobacteria bacterium]
MKNRTVSALKTLMAPRNIHHTARIKIRHLDLEPIKFKLVKESGWTLAQADRVGALYKGFLLLHALYPHDTHVPTHEIDDMWHAHILDTAKYMADCHEIFGAYLHHFPYLGLRGDDDAAFADESFAATRARFIEVCGLDPLLDDVRAADCGGGGGCSSSSCSSGGDSGGDNSNDAPSTPDKGDSGNSGGGKGKGSCTTYVPFNDPASGRTNPGGRSTPPATPPATRRQPEPKPLWRRILGLSGATDLSVDVWTASVDPASRLATAQRPGRDELIALADEVPEGVTKH